MKKIRKITISIIGIVCIVSLFACGVNNDYVVAETAAASVPMVAYGTNGFSRKTSSMKQMAVADMAMDTEEMAIENPLEGGVTERKIIKTYSINTETKEFEKSVNWFKTYVNEFGGIIDNSYVDSGNKEMPTYRKMASFTVRVPSDKAKEFLSKIGTELNVTFEQEDSRDVTDSYNDTEARINTLNIEQDKLNELLKKAKTVEDIIKIEEKLSEVRHELQNITNRLKRMDKQIDYTTFNVTISEVINLTEAINKEDLSKENLLKQLNKNFEATKRFIIRTGVFLFVNIPAICLGLIVLVVVLLIILIIKVFVDKKHKKKEKSASKTVKQVNKKSSEVATSEKTKKAKTNEEN